MDSWLGLTKRAGGDSATRLLCKKFLAKELLASVGNVVAYKTSALVRVKPGEDEFRLSRVVFAVCEQFMDTPKVTKTGIAALINIAAIGMRERILTGE